jgi:hypothetical protein
MLDNEPEKQVRVVERAVKSLGHFLSTPVV